MIPPAYAHPCLLLGTRRTRSTDHRPAQIRALAFSRYRGDTFAVVCGQLLLHAGTVAAAEADDDDNDDDDDDDDENEDWTVADCYYQFRAKTASSKSPTATG